MASPDFFKNVQIKLLENFISQDVENGYFDVCFKIGEKSLHAHKAILAAVSKPFDVMFAERWTTKDQPIELKEYSYDDYKEFMTFIYSGNCELKNDNILSLVDMAEFYDISNLKSFCDVYLAKKSYSAEDVFQYVELARKYSLVQLEEALKINLDINFCLLLKSDEFMKCNKSIVKEFVDFAAKLAETENEQCFIRVVEWAQNQAETKMNESNNEKLDLQNGIKNVLSGILSQFNFSKMSLLFLNGTVAKYSYLFSGEELSKLLMGSRKIIVTVTTIDTKPRVFTLALTGEIPYDQEIFDILFPLRNYLSNSICDGWKSMRVQTPEKPSFLKKNNAIPFYLVIRDKYVYLFPPSYITETDYLIAEMKTTGGFYFTGQFIMNICTNF